MKYLECSKSLPSLPLSHHSVLGKNRCIHCLPEKHLPSCNQVILQCSVDFHSTFVVCGLGEVKAANASTCLFRKRKDGSGSTSVQRRFSSCFIVPLPCLQQSKSVATLGGKENKITPYSCPEILL